MDNKLIVRQKKSETILWCILLLAAMIVFWTINLQDPNETSIFFYVIISFFLICLCMILVLYFGSYLIIENDLCVCRDMLKKRTFHISDIGKIQMRYPKYAKMGILVLYDNNDQIIIELPKSLNNIDKVIPYVQKYKSTKFEVTDLSETTANKEVLIVRPNKYSLLEVIIPVVGVVLILLGILWIIFIDKSRGFGALILILSLFIIVFGILWYFKIKKKIQLYRYFRLVLTNDDCYFIDELNRQNNFKLNDIKLVKISRGVKAPAYLHIILNSNLYIPSIVYDRTYDNVKSIIPFIEKHLGRIIT